MIGIEPEKARKTYNIPDDYEVLTGFAIGYADLNKKVSDIFAERDQTPRSRKTISEFVFNKNWEASFV